MIDLMIDFRCLVPLSAIFQLYHVDQFQWWKKPEYPERTTHHGQATGKLYHLRLRVECTIFCNLQSRARTHAVLVIGLYELLGNPTTYLIQPPGPSVSKLSLTFRSGECSILFLRHLQRVKNKKISIYRFCIRTIYINYINTHVGNGYLQTWDMSIYCLTT